MHNLDIFLPEAGFLALLLSLGVNVLTPLATWYGIGQHWCGVMRLTTCGAWTAFTLLLLAFAILVSCFLTSDFSVVYVAQHSHSQLSWGLKLAAVWGGHEGSLLLWALLLSGWTALFAWRTRHEFDALFSTDPEHLVPHYGLVAAVYHAVVRSVSAYFSSRH